MEEINIRIEQLKERVDQQRELIVGINNEIEHKQFTPNASQQALIDYICQEGRKALAEIERLERFKQQFDQ